VGQRITFRGRGRGCVIKDPISNAVSFVEPRVKFIKGYAGSGSPPEGSVSVGAGTEYPILVTQDQIAEIMYRVKDAKIIQGSTVQTDIYDGETFIESVSILAGTPDERLASDPVLRGYVERQSSSSLPTSLLSEFYTEGEGYFRDILDDERALWLPVFNSGVGYYGQEFKTAFSFSAAEMYAYPASTAPYRGISSKPDENGYSIQLVFSGDIAWIGDGDSPFDSTSQLYLGVKFEAYEFQLFDSATCSTVLGGRPFSASCDRLSPLYFKIQLAGGVLLSCPLYAVSPNISGSDWIIAATEWWPYQDKGANVWNPATGLRA